MKNTLKLAVVILLLSMLGGYRSSSGQTIDWHLFLPYVPRDFSTTQYITFWALSWSGSEEYPNKSLKVVDSNGNGLKTLTESSFGYRLHAADWSPDGTKIVYSDYTSDENQHFSYDIFVVEIASNTRMKLTHSTGNYAGPQWSPDGQKIAFVASEYPALGGIYTMNPDGTELTPLLQQINPSPRNVMWSPDSARIGFLVGGELFVMNADGTGLTKVTNKDDFSVSVATWAPTANQIAFDAPAGAVYVINADGTGLVELPYGMRQPAWAPDSTQIAYECQIDSIDNICIVHTDGTGLVTIPLAADGISWSSTGEKLVFTSGWDENANLYTINLDGSNLTQITSSETLDVYPLWQP